MHASHFATALIAALTCSLTEAREFKETWAPMLEQEQWTRDIAFYQFATTMMRDWFYDHLPI